MHTFGHLYAYASYRILQQVAVIVMVSRSWEDALKVVTTNFDGPLPQRINTNPLLRSHTDDRRFRLPYKLSSKSILICSLLTFTSQMNALLQHIFIKQ